MTDFLCSALSIGCLVNFLMTTSLLRVRMFSAERLFLREHDVAVGAEGNRAVRAGLGVVGEQHLAAGHPVKGGRDGVAGHVSDEGHAPVPVRAGKREDRPLFVGVRGEFGTAVAEHVALATEAVESRHDLHTACARLGLGRVVPIGHLVLAGVETVGKHTQFRGVREFVAGVDHRDAVEQVVHHLDHLHAVMTRQDLDALGPVGHGIVVVHVEEQFGTCRDLCFQASEQVREIGHGLLPRQDPVQDVVPGGAIGTVKTAQEITPITPLVDEDRIGFDEAHTAARLDPEVDRDTVSHVAAETVHVDLTDVVEHIAIEIFAHAVRRKVNAGEVPHGADGVALRILFCKIGVPTENRRVRSDMQIHEVEQYLHPAVVRGGDEITQVIHRAVLGVDFVVVVDAVGILRVIGPRRLLPRAPIGAVGRIVLLKNRAEVNDVETEFREGRECLRDRSDGPLPRERPRVDVVNGRAAEPLRRANGGKFHGLSPFGLAKCAKLYTIKYDTIETGFFRYIYYAF